MFDVIKGFLRARKIPAYPREKVTALREKLLRETISNAYISSQFYRNLWAQNGITKENLATIPLNRFPLVTKRQLMESFGTVVADPSITRQNVEDFIHSDPFGAKLYKNKYIAINTSGSSGFVGLFLFTKKFWENLIGTVVARLIPLPISDFLTGRVRIAFVGEVSGHHAGVSLVRAAPPVFKTLSVDVSSPAEELARQLGAFQPTVLVGYSSGLGVVSELQIEKKIHINPKVIISSGEPLSTSREERISTAFGVRPFDFYGCTECLAIGASLYDSAILDMFDDVAFLETVDDKGNSVPPGTVGRVVLTVFGNSIQPLIRYSLDDELTLNPESAEHPFTRATQVTGRKLERLTLVLPNGRTVEVHPMDLVGLFFPGLKQYQVIQTDKNTVALNLVVEGNKEKIMGDVHALTDALLQEKGLTQKDVNIEVHFTDSIAPNPKTGKTPIIIPLQT